MYTYVVQKKHMEFFYDMEIILFILLPPLSSACSSLRLVFFLFPSRPAIIFTIWLDCRLQLHLYSYVVYIIIYVWVNIYICNNYGICLGWIWCSIFEKSIYFQLCTYKQNAISNKGNRIMLIAYTYLLEKKAVQKKCISWKEVKQRLNTVYTY